MLDYAYIWFVLAYEVGKKKLKKKKKNLHNDKTHIKILNEKLFPRYDIFCKSYGSA